MYFKYNAVLRGTGADALAWMHTTWKELTLGNMYVTSLHVINSCIVKGSKLTKADRVYRGFGSGVLPSTFWEPNEFGVKGGVEAAFMSTTTDKRVAMQYARGGKGGLLFEIRMGMVDRGADLSWLSQYPHEKEILFVRRMAIEAPRPCGVVTCVEGRMPMILSAL